MRVPVIGILGVVIGVGLISGSCGGKSPIEPTPVCTVTVAPASLTFQTDGGTGAIAVSTAAGCNWTATASAGWIAISGATGNGGGTATYAVAANPAQEARTGSVTIAGQVHAVSQAGRPVDCSYGISPTSASVNKDATAGAIAVTAPATCGWTATSSAPWLVLADGGQGTGNGSVSYTVTRNLETADRTATISVVRPDLQDDAVRRHGRLPVLGRAGGPQRVHGRRDADDHRHDAAQLHLDRDARCLLAGGVRRERHRYRPHLGDRPR